MRPTYSVHYSVEQPTRFTRIQLLIRLLAFCVLGMVGVSFGLVFAVLFVGLPVFAAVRLASRDAALHPYVAEDGPKVVNMLRWVAAFSAWAGLISDELPRRSPDETVRIEVEPDAHSTASSALLRILLGLPSAIVLALLCCIGTFVWIWAALSILFVERVGTGAFNYLVGLQRWSVRLLTYQASLVEEYPPFSFADVRPTELPPAARPVELSHV